MFLSAVKLSMIPAASAPLGHSDTHIRYTHASDLCSLLQKYPEHAIRKVLQLMLRRGEIQHRMQRKVLYRLK